MWSPTTHIKKIKTHSKTCNFGNLSHPFENCDSSIGRACELACQRGLQSWTSIFTQPRFKANSFAQYGEFGSFKANFSPSCTCLSGFTFPTEEQKQLDWPVSYARKTHIQCENIILLLEKKGKLMAIWKFLTWNGLLFLRYTARRVLKRVNIYSYI